MVLVTLCKVEVSWPWTRNTLDRSNFLEGAGDAGLELFFVAPFFNSVYLL